MGSTGADDGSTLVNRLKNAFRFFGAPFLWIAILVAVVLLLARGYPLAWLHPTEVSVNVVPLRQISHPEDVRGEIIGSGWVAEPADDVPGQRYLLTACTETSGFGVYVDGNLYTEVERVDGLSHQTGSTPVLSVSLPWGHVFSRVGSSEYFILKVDGDDIVLHSAHPPAGQVTSLHTLGASALVISTELHDTVRYMQDFPAAQRMKRVASDQQWDAGEEVEIDNMHPEELFVEYTALVDERQSAGSQFKWPEAALLSIDEVRFPQTNSTRWGALSFHLEDLPEAAPNSASALRLQVIQDDNLQQRLQMEHLPEGNHKPRVVFPSLRSADDEGLSFSENTLLHTESEALLLDEQQQPVWRFEPPKAVLDHAVISSVVLLTDGRAVVGAGDHLFFVGPDGNPSGQLIFTSPVREIVPLEDSRSLMVVIMNDEVALCSVAAENLWSAETDSAVVDWAVSPLETAESPRWRLDVLTHDQKHSYVIGTPSQR